VAENERLWTDAWVLHQQKCIGNAYGRAQLPVCKQHSPD
jgi:hypothetical protein